MAEEAQQEASKRGGGKGLLFIIVGVVILVFVLIGVIAFVFLSGGGDDKKEHAQAPVPTAMTADVQMLMQNDSLRNPVAIFPLEGDTIVNLKSSNPDDASRGGYLLFAATLILADKNLAKEIEVKKDIVKSIIISTISNYTSENLQSSQGAQKLKVDVVNNLNAILQDGKVSAVVFPKFTIQP